MGELTRALEYIERELRMDMFASQNGSNTSPPFSKNNQCVALTNACSFIAAGDLITVMSYKTLNKGTKAKKGISPVIATVILVAVAVVIAAALAGFSSSLFGSYSQSSQISIRSMELLDDGSATLQIVNKGAAAETVSSVKISEFGTATTAAGEITETVGGGAPIIPANSEASISVSAVLEGAGDLIAGQTVTLTVETQSGQTYTLSTIVQA